MKTHDSRGARDSLVDELVHDAGVFATGLDWSPHLGSGVVSARRSRARHLREGVLALVVAGVVATLLLVPLPQLHLFGMGSPGSPPKSKLAMEVDQLAEDWAASCHDPNPVSVTWVSIPTHKAKGIAFLGHPDNSGPPGVYMEIRGSFVCDYFSVPAGTRAAGAFTDFAGVVIRPCFTGSDRGGMNTFPSLAAIGPPETDSLAGYKPDGAAAFDAEFSIPASCTNDGG
jgi:hypothetical protein